LDAPSKDTGSIALSVEIITMATDLLLSVSEFCQSTMGVTESKGDPPESSQVVVKNAKNWKSA
jgi:hypothetical protein